MPADLSSEVDAGWQSSLQVKRLVFADCHWQPSVAPAINVAGDCQLSLAAKLYQAPAA